jgi:toxin secretion/phage lysis holin
MFPLEIENSWIRLFNAIKLGVYFIFAYLNINAEVFGILMTLMVIDSLVGSIKAIRLSKEFRFRILIWGICIKLLILLIPMVVALVAKAIGKDFTLAVNWVMNMLIVAEAYSILGNIYDAKNKTHSRNLDLISMIIQSLKNMIGRKLSSSIEAIEKEGSCDDLKKNKDIDDNVND